MPTGRRDGQVPRAENVNLPGPTLSVAEANSAFNAKGLTQADMVTLLGAHKVGVTHFSIVNDRLWDFQRTGLPDPAMDAALVAKLKALCPEQRVGLGDVVNLDQCTPDIVDKSFFNQILVKKGILQLDQTLATSRITSWRTALLAEGPGLRSLPTLWLLSSCWAMWVSCWAKRARSATFAGKSTKCTISKLDSRDGTKLGEKLQDIDELSVETSWLQL